MRECFAACVCAGYTIGAETAVLSVAAAAASEAASVPQTQHIGGGGGGGGPTSTSANAQHLAKLRRVRACRSRTDEVAGCCRMMAVYTSVCSYVCNVSAVNAADVASRALLHHAGNFDGRACALRMQNRQREGED